MDLSKQFRQHADLFLQRTAWTSPCKSWFKQGRADGQAVIYPGSRLSFFHLMEKPRYEDFEIEYWDDNRYAFLGNGTSPASSLDFMGLRCYLVAPSGFVCLRYALIYCSAGFDTREFDGRDITNYLGLLDGEDKQPDYDPDLINTLAGWAVGK